MYQTIDDGDDEFDQISKINKKSIGLTNKNNHNQYGTKMNSCK